jgi:hypothetical protein
MGSAKVEERLMSVGYPGKIRSEAPLNPVVSDIATCRYSITVVYALLLDLTKPSGLCTLTWLWTEPGPPGLRRLPLPLRDE